MIPFDFEYYRPSTIAEAIETFNTQSSQGKNTIFLSGGTEFITFARNNHIYADVVIDIKGIPECHTLEMDGEQLVIGAAVSLNKITNSGLFPLLGQKVKQIADHTSRNKITIGGNINSQLIYREGILPLLLADCKVKIAGNEGEKILPLNDVFNKELKIGVGQFLVQILVDSEYTGLPFVSIKKTKISKVGYPVVSVAAMVKDNMIRAAFSGVCDYPFRSEEIESVLNDNALSIMEKIDQVVATLPSQVINDIEGSSEYREYVLKNVLSETIEGLKGA